MCGPAQAFVPYFVSVSSLQQSYSFPSMEASSHTVILRILAPPVGAHHWKFLLNKVIVFQVPEKNN